ncbi:MAG: hypothetical protein ACRC76_15125 [Proteocatella sp.]
MTDTLLSLFPTTLRLNRKKNNFDKLQPYVSVLIFATFILYNVFFLHLNLFFSITEAIEKIVVLYITYLIMIELSPDNPNIYMISYIIIGISLVFFSRLYISSSLFFLFNIRILTKSSGYQSSIYELLTVFIFTIIEYFFSPFLYPLIFAIILILDYKFKHSDARNIPFIVLSILMSMLWMTNGFSLLESNLNIFSSLIVIVLGIAYILRLSLLKNILSFNDIESNAISPKRVKASSLVLLLSLIVLAIAHATVLEFINLWVMIACLSFPFLKDLKHTFKS